MSGTRPITIRDNATYNAAQRCGAEIDTQKKYAAGSNRQHVAAVSSAKLEEESENFHIETVPRDVGQLIALARQNCNLTQKDLATKINEKPQVIAEYEQGKAIPNQTILGKLERALGIKLRGKDKGAPFAKGSKK
uniref:Endothelial differentiation-related factor 1 homolog n=1 Tax=Schistocephalus solidus TaxID=70667 RepID=A0A0X3PE24_SCHSO